MINCHSFLRSLNSLPRGICGSCRRDQLPDGDYKPDNRNRQSGNTKPIPETHSICPFTQLVFRRVSVTSDSTCRRCPVEPYWIKAAALCAAAPGRTCGGSA